MIEKIAEPDRQRFIGGSDAAAVIGISEWSTPLAVYYKKRGEVLPEEIAEDPIRERYFKRGRLMEPVILEMLIGDYGLEVVRRSSPEARNYHVDLEHPFLAAEIDFEWRVTDAALRAFAAKEHDLDPALLGTVQNGEIKSMDPVVAWRRLGEEGSDEIPVEYFAQAMHGLMVSGRELALVAVGAGWEPRVFWVRRDEETIAGMRAKEVAFWREHVLAGVPPPPVNVPDIYRMLKRRLATRFEATPEVAALLATYKSLSSRKAAWEDGLEALRFEIGSAVLGQAATENPAAADKGKHIIAVGGRAAMTITLEEQERIDAERLRREEPQVAKRFTKTTKFYKFSLTRSKS